MHKDKIKKDNEDFQEVIAPGMEFEISNEDLDDVNGARDYDGDLTQYEFYNEVGMYSGVVGYKYYFVRNMDHGKFWVYGTLLDTWERRINIFHTRRMHKVYVEKATLGGNFHELEMEGREYTMYWSRRKKN